jgi:hypothetical protein
MKACGGAAFSKQLGVERIFRDARAGWVMAPTVDHLQDFRRQGAHRTAAVLAHSGRSRGHALNDTTFTWNVRVTPGGPDASRVHARNHSFDVGRQASFRDADPCPSAIELALGALGGDLASGWRAEAERRGHRARGAGADAAVPARRSAAASRRRRRVGPCRASQRSRARST